MFNSGMSNSDTDFELCLRAENVFLPSRGYFGVSAATGGLAGKYDNLCRAFELISVYLIYFTQF